MGFTLCRFTWLGFEIHLITAVSVIKRLSLYVFTLLGWDLVSVVCIRESHYYRGLFKEKYMRSLSGHWKLSVLERCPYREVQLYKRVLIQRGKWRRSCGHKINSQIECTIVRKIQTSLEMFKTFYSSSDWRMICFYSNIGCSESKVIFKWRKNNKNKKRSLYNEQTFAPRVFHSVSVRTLTERDKQTQAIRDAQKLAQNVFPPWKTNIDVT